LEATVYRSIAGKQQYVTGGKRRSSFIFYVHPETVSSAPSHFRAATFSKPCIYEARLLGKRAIPEFART
jgi:hypothetical protein